jgi:SAM-dependent methyltransferase
MEALPPDRSNGTPPPETEFLSNHLGGESPGDPAALIVTPPPELLDDVPTLDAGETNGDGNFDAGAIPSRAMHESDSERNLSPLAHTLAHMAQAARQAEIAPDGEELASDDALELMDAPIDPLPAEALVEARPRPRAATPPPVPTGAPPPIPGAFPRPPVPKREEGVVRIPLPILPEALTQRPRRPKRSKPWFEEVFDEDYLRTLPFMTAEQTLKEVSFIEESLEARGGAEILDVACGYGRHAIELVQRGLKITGLDLSLPLLIRAADESQRRSLSVNFVHADMREMAFEQQFDGAYCVLTSFGYFDEDTNLRVAEGIARALKPGGRLLLDVVNRDYVVGDLPTRVWWEGTGCVVLEEVDFNFHTSRIVTRRSVVFEDGRQLEQEISVRAYSLHELGRLLRQAGFRVIDISGSLATRGRFFGSASRNIIILAEKRSD